MTSHILSHFKDFDQIYVLFEKRDYEAATFLVGYLKRHFRKREYKK